MCLFLYPRPQLAPAIQSTTAILFGVHSASLLISFFFMAFPNSSTDLTVLTYPLHFQHHCIHSAFFSSFILVSFMSSLALCPAVYAMSFSFSLRLSLCLSLNSPCCCDDLSLLQDSLTSHIFSFSPPPLPLKQLSYRLADNLISMDCPLSWTKCAWQTVVRHLSPCILSCNGLCCLFSPGRDKKNS